MNRGITKRTQINSSWTDIIVLYKNVYKTNAHTVFCPSPYRADSLARCQSEYPMAQKANSQPPQTAHVESDQTTSEQLRKLPTQLKTQNILVADLVRVQTLQMSNGWVGVFLP